MTRRKIHRQLKALKKEHILIRRLCFAPERLLEDEAQLALARKLIKKYPGASFWTTLEFNFKPLSLNWFFTTEGREFLEAKWALSKLEIPPKEILEISDKLVENASTTVTPPKPKTLFNFLKYGKTKEK